MRASTAALKPPTTTFSPTTTGDELLLFLCAAVELIVHRSLLMYSEDDVGDGGKCHTEMSSKQISVRKQARHFLGAVRCLQALGHIDTPRHSCA